MKRNYTNMGDLVSTLSWRNDKLFAQLQGAFPLPSGFDLEKHAGRLLYDFSTAGVDTTTRVVCFLDPLTESVADSFDVGAKVDVCPRRRLSRTSETRDRLIRILGGRLSPKPPEARIVYFYMFSTNV